jgi:hypothetical protein
VLLSPIFWLLRSLLDWTSHLVQCFRDIEVFTFTVAPFSTVAAFTNVLEGFTVLLSPTTLSLL